MALLGFSVPLLVTKLTQIPLDTLIDLLQPALHLRL
jgi:hypothetical protein